MPKMCKIVTVIMFIVFTYFCVGEESKILLDLNKNVSSMEMDSVNLTNNSFQSFSNLSDKSLSLYSSLDIFYLDYLNNVNFTKRVKRPSLIGPFDITRKRKTKQKQSKINGPTAQSLKSNDNFLLSFSNETLNSQIHTNTSVTTNLTQFDKVVSKNRLDSKVSKVSKKKQSKLRTNSSLIIMEKTILKKSFLENDTIWPVKHAAVVEGDIVLGGLMMVHSRSKAATCGPVMAQGGIQALEAMLYALDTVSESGLLPPGIKLGAHILDDCDNDTYGLEMALDFIKGSISNIDDAEYACNATVVRKVISGVVGAASSVTSVQVANLLRLFKIPQVSFFSTSPELSNKARFEYFTRTIPSDLHQVRAMVEIVKKLGWSYVSIIYEESNYGLKAFEELETILARNDICIAVKEKLVKDSGEADASAYDAIIAKLLTRPRARGVIIFGSDQEVAGVMSAVSRANATDAFSWVGSDGWSSRALVSDGNEPAVEGTISVQPQANPVKGFREYFLNLTVEKNKRNPWFVEFWEEQFLCKYPFRAKTPYNIHYKRNCTGQENLSNENIQFEAQLQFVADAVWAFAFAIRDMHQAMCGNLPGLCEVMRPASGAALLRFLRQVRFTGLSGDEFHFDNNGDGPARYNILHFKQVQRGVYKWLRVGKYLDGVLELDIEDIQFKWGTPRPPESVCSAECETGQAKQYVEGESCCWHCFNCTQYEIRSPLLETSCSECMLGWVPALSRSECIPVPPQYLSAYYPAALGAMAFSSTGLLLTALVVTIWIIRGETPVVRASGKELSFVLLSGIAMCYLITFTLVLKPSNFLCAIQRFSTGLCFTIVYAALLTKTNRISRIFDASKHSARRPPLISPKSQLLICFILVSIQVIIVVVWQIVSPARAMNYYPTREDNLLVCDSYIDASYTIAFFYPVILIVVCTVYAVLTRKIPEAFNESKHIGFAMYTTCVIWLAFVPLYFGTASHVALRVTSMAVTISLSASVTLVCLFAPKVYIILARPERNVRGRLAGARGAVCAALVGSAPAHANANPKMNIEPERSSTSKLVQTDEIFTSMFTPVNGLNNKTKEKENGVRLSAVTLPPDAVRVFPAPPKPVPGDAPKPEPIIAFIGQEIQL